MSVKKRAKIQKWTIEKINDYIEGEEGNGCKLLSTEYGNCMETLLFKCKCNDEFKTQWRSFYHQNKRQCNKCSRKEKSDSKKLDFEYIKSFIEGEDGNGCKLISTEYSMAKHKLKIECACNTIFETSFAKFFSRNKRQCNACGQENVAKLSRHTYDFVKESIESRSSHILISEEYINNREPLILECSSGHRFKRSFVDFITGNIHCSKCCASAGEQRVLFFLEKNKINFQMEYSFEDLRGVNGGLLRFDFVIFDNNKNLSYLIEYDGQLHFSNKFNNSNYDILLTHDERKNQYCKDNNIPLLRIPYWEFDNIEEILEDVLIDELGLIKEVHYEH